MGVTPTYEDISLKSGSASPPRRLLVVERKLISNRGHHHTQIGALKAFFPDHEFFLVAGEGYDGFAGEAVAKLSQRYSKLARLKSKRVHGDITQKISGAIGSIRAGKWRLPGSAYGQQLTQIVRDVGMSRDDIIVVPTAEIDLLESLLELSLALGSQAPKIALRFLGPEFGEANPVLRSRRLKALASRLTSNIFLFTETDELATHMRAEFALDAVSGMFLLCSVPFTDIPSPSAKGEYFKIGILGSPRPEKGSVRIPKIVKELANRSLSLKKYNGVEFLVQGADADFQNSGVYGPLAAYSGNDGSVKVTPLGDRLSPDQFSDFFKACDVILIPYDVSTYGLQGSGIIQDAVAAFKPLIYSYGMSMKNFLSHGNAIGATTDKEFSDAIVEVITFSDQFAAGAIVAANYYSDVLKKSPLQRLLA